MTPEDFIDPTIRSWPARFVSEQAAPESVEAHTKELMQTLSALPPLSTAQLGRIANQLSERISEKGVERRRPWLVYGTAAAAVVGCLVVGAKLLPREPPGEIATGKMVDVPDGVVASLIGERGLDVVLVGPGHAVLGKHREVQLRSGRLAVRAHETQLPVELSGVRVIVRPGAIVEIGVESSQLTVAAYRGAATIEWQESRRQLEITEGTQFEHDRVLPIGTLRPAEIDRFMSTASANDKPATNELPNPAADVGARANLNEAASLNSRLADVTPAPVPHRPPHHSLPARATARLERPYARSVSTASDRPMANAPAIAPAPVAREPLFATLPLSAPKTEATVSAPAAVAKPAAPSPLAEESRLLADALRHLGPANDPKGALAVIARYQAAFPTGRLRPEADRAHVDALLRLDRRKGALEVLEHMSASEVGSGELRVLRGELRSELRQYRAAVDDFDAALLGVQSASLKERALYGRAVSRARLLSSSGDSTAARSDFDRYLSEFPNGRFAAEARRAVGK